MYQFGMHLVQTYHRFHNITRGKNVDTISTGVAGNFDFIKENVYCLLQCSLTFHVIFPTFYICIFLELRLTTFQ